MVEYKKSSDASSETLFSKCVNKTAKNGRVVGSVVIEVKTFDGFKFIQVTQDKQAFGNQPAKRSWITIDPRNKELKEALTEAYRV